MLQKRSRHENPNSLFVKKHGIYVPKSYANIKRFQSLKEKTLWDWLQLLIVPVLLALGGFALNWQANLRQERLSQERRQQEERLAEEQRQQEVLNIYLDKMSELLIDKGLRNAKINSEVFVLGQSRTVTALRRLDFQRKALLFDFLRSAKLSSSDGRSGILRKSILADMNFEKFNFIDFDLRESNLERANLKETILRQVNLERANLSYANLQDSGLSEVNFKGAYLARTNFRKALLRRVDFQKAALWGVDFREAGLNEVNLQGADLVLARLIKTFLGGANCREASFEGAYLWDADLRNANLQNANLKRADLSGSSLIGVNLAGANLTSANLVETDLSNIRNWTDQQLSLAKLCHTKLPTGSKLNSDRDCEELRNLKN